MRLRQGVLVAEDLDAAVAALRDTFALGEPYPDPGVAVFGLVDGLSELLRAADVDGTAGDRERRRRGHPLGTKGRRRGGAGGKAQTQRDEEC